MGAGTVVNSTKFVRVSTGFQSSAAVFPETPTGGGGAPLLFFIKGDSNRGSILFQLIILNYRRSVHNGDGVGLPFVEVCDRDVA